MIRGILSVIQKGFAERLQKTCWLLNCLLSNRFFLIFNYLYCVSGHLIYNWLFMHWWLYTLIHLVLRTTHWGLISIQINKFHLNGSLRHWIYCICSRLLYGSNSNIIIVVYDVSVVDNTGFFSILRDRSRSWAKISKFELFRFLSIRWRWRRFSRRYLCLSQRIACDCKCAPYILSIINLPLLFNFITALN